MKQSAVIYSVVRCQTVFVTRDRVHWKRRSPHTWWETWDGSGSGSWAQFTKYSQTKENEVRTPKWDIVLARRVHKIHPFSVFSSFTSPYQYCQEQNTHLIYHQLYHLGTRNHHNHPPPPPQKKKKQPVSEHLLVLLDIGGKHLFNRDFIIESMSWQCLPWQSYTNMKIMSLFAHPYVVSELYDFCRTQNFTQCFGHGLVLFWTLLTFIVWTKAFS